MRQTYKGKYRVKNPAKYAGDPDTVTYRSSWELAAMNWADRNPAVLEWSSEEVVIPYICATDLRPHRYFLDLRLKMENGETYLVEIKPSKETKPPSRKGKKRAKFLEETATFAKNSSKWAAARKFAERNGWKFVIWDENTLKRLRILKG